jgi:hypothetical protein
MPRQMLRVIARSAGMNLPTCPQGNFPISVLSSVSRRASGFEASLLPQPGRLRPEVDLAPKCPKSPSSRPIAARWAGDQQSEDEFSGPCTRESFMGSAIGEGVGENKQTLPSKAPDMRSRSFPRCSASLGSGHERLLMAHIPGRVLKPAGFDKFPRHLSAAVGST